MKITPNIWVALLLFSACQTRTPYQKQTIASHQKEDELRILSYPPKNRFRQLELELVKSQDTLTLYLNTHAYPIPSENSKATLTLKTTTRSYTYHLPLLAGNARIKLCQPLADRILSLLDSETPFTLAIDKHSLTPINTSGSSKALYWLLTSPIIPRPSLKLDI